jgi:hypothetical protein
MMTGQTLTFPRVRLFLSANKVAPQAKERGRVPSAGGDENGVRGGNKMADLNQRIETMYRNDCRGAWTLIVFLWLAILFVLIMTWPYIPDTTIAVVTAIGAVAILVFNTASIAAMVKHYEEDKEFIYGLDIRHLDAMRESGRL